MASGIPVVAVAAGGIPNIIDRPGRNGFLYARGDMQACAAHIRTLMGDNQVYAAVQATALEVRARHRFEIVSSMVFQPVGFMCGGCICMVAGNMILHRCVFCGFSTVCIVC